MSRLFLRRAQLDEKVKQQIRKRVQELLKEKQNNPDQPDSAQNDAPENDPDSDGAVYLFDASDHSRSMVALEFDTRKEYELYKKEHDVDPGTKIRILEESGGKSKQQDEPSEKRGPAKEEAPKDRKPGKNEPEGKPVKKEEQGKPGKDKQDDKQPDKDKPETQEKKEERQPGEPLPHEHPSRIPEGMHRQVAIKDQLIDEFGADAKSWKVHKLFPFQITKNVTIKFPDGSDKKYGDLTPDEKTRVDKAVSEGLAASKGLGDYTSVTMASMQHNMATNLARYDDTSVEEVKNESADPVSPSNAEQTSKSLRENGRTVLKKYGKMMSSVSRPMAERFVDDMADAVSEGIKDGSLSGVHQSDLDEFVREDVKRMLHQETETRRRALGDHGIRHVAGNARNMMEMFRELQNGGTKVTGKQKFMALSAMANHDIGYTVGEAATDPAKGKKHKQFSKDLVDQEKDRYDKIFGQEDGGKVRDIIATHDDPKFDWEQDPVGSCVRLADNISLFGEDKVQDLFLRSPKAAMLCCKLHLAAQANPSDKKLQEEIKSQLHEVVDGGEFDEADREPLHNQIDEMTEGKFSTTTDILSRYSGELKGFKYDSDKKLMHVNMQYSTEGQVIDGLFGDEVACRQFEKMTKDLGGNPVRGKRGNTLFKSADGKPAFQLDIDGFDTDKNDSPYTPAMRDFQKQTARYELQRAVRRISPPPPANERDFERAKRAVEPAKEKFTEAEWKKLMEAFDEGKGDPVELAKKLNAWPLLQSEMAYLESKTASVSAVVRRIMLSYVVNRVAEDMLGLRGLSRVAFDLAEDIAYELQTQTKTTTRSEMKLRLILLGLKGSLAEKILDKWEENVSLWHHSRQWVAEWVRRMMGPALVTAARGMQVRRKDTDTIHDTGGVSKHRQRDPEMKPPREDLSNPHRTKDKPSGSHDPDTDGDPDLKSRKADGPSGIRRVTYYTAYPVETCDRCSAAIRQVALVEWKDGTKKKFGSECINKILAGDNSLKSLFKKNAVLLRKYQMWLEVLNRPVDRMPKVQEYYSSGIYMIGDDEGRNIVVERGSILFHPDVDLNRNVVSRYPFVDEETAARYTGKKTYEQFRAEQFKSIEKGKAFLQGEINHLESFLAKIVEKGLLKAEQAGIQAAAAAHPLDVIVKGTFGDVPEDNYYRRAMNSLIEVMAQEKQVSEKDFGGMEELRATAEELVRSIKGDTMIRVFQSVGARPEMCAEGLYFETFIKDIGKQASDGAGLRVKLLLAQTPRTLHEAVERG